VKTRIARVLSATSRAFRAGAQASDARTQGEALGGAKRKPEETAARRSAAVRSVRGIVERTRLLANRRFSVGLDV
jgi:hypothetical protein